MAEMIVRAAQNTPAPFSEEAINIILADLHYEETRNMLRVQIVCQALYEQAIRRSRPAVTPELLADPEIGGVEGIIGRDFDLAQKLQKSVDRGGALARQILSHFVRVSADSVRSRVMSEDRMPGPLNGSQLLDMYFLEMRCHLLEVAAGFDRIQRASGAEAAAADPRAVKLRRALDVLGSSTPDRAERFLDLFSE
jgi:hypothetical protein